MVLSGITYTLFDGLAYDSNEQNVRSYYMLNHRIRGLLFHYKKIVILQFASILFRFSVIKLSTSSSLSCPVSVCSVVSFCSVKSVSVNKSSSSLKKIQFQRTQTSQN